MVGVATRRILVVRGQENLGSCSVVGRVGVGMTSVADPSRSTVDHPVRDPVVLTKTCTVAEAFEANPILGTAVAARACYRIEAVSAAGGAQVDLSTAGAHAAVAGIAVARQHVVAMGVVEIVCPRHPLGERCVGAGGECAVAVGTEIDVVFVGRVELVCRGVVDPEGYGQRGHRPDHENTE